MPAWDYQHLEGDGTIVKSAQPIGKPGVPAKAGLKRRAPASAAAWTLLALYLVAYAPAGLGLAALAGSLDRGHQVQFCGGDRGLALVLHHGRNCAVQRHGVIARALVCFAQPASAADPDHILQFAAADTLSPRALLIPPPLPSPAQPAGLPADSGGTPSADARPEMPRPRPPPAQGEPARCLRSIVLLL